MMYKKSFLFVILICIVRLFVVLPGILWFDFFRKRAFSGNNYGTIRNLLGPETKGQIA